MEQQVTEGLGEGGVLPILKHIPGHGRAMADSHLSLTVVDTPKNELESIDFAAGLYTVRGTNRSANIDRTTPNPEDNSSNMVFAKLMFTPNDSNRLRLTLDHQDGETDWNVARRLQGLIDTPLNSKGVRQAEGWRPYFDRIRLAAIYSSSLQRAIDTAAFATGRPARPTHPQANLHARANPQVRNCSMQRGFHSTAPKCRSTTGWWT